MNKKISTLLTAGLLMVGALLGSANAALQRKPQKVICRMVQSST